MPPYEITQLTWTKSMTSTTTETSSARGSSLSVEDWIGIIVGIVFLCGVIVTLCKLLLSLKSYIV